MKIEVKHNCTYASLVITECCATIESGLLNAKERNEMAIQLVNAAEQIFDETDDAWVDFIHERVL